MLKSNDWLTVITPISRQDVKTEMVCLAAFKKTLIYCSHWVQSGEPGSEAQERFREVGFPAPAGLLCKSQGPTKRGVGP